MKAPHIPDVSFETCPTCHKNLKVIKPRAQVNSGGHFYCSQICAELDKPNSALAAARSKTHRTFTR